MRLLLIDASAAVRQELGEALRRHGFLCDDGASYAEARDMMATVAYAAIVLDPVAPGASGADQIRDLRQRWPDVPVLVMSGASDLAERIDALDAGADDHLAKPFDPEELAARLRAVLRRSRSSDRNLRLGDLAFDPRTLELAVAGSPVVVTARERQLMALLMHRGGRVVTKRFAEDQLFGHSVALGSNAVEVYVHRLRRRLRDAGSTVRVDTIRGVGYLLRVDAPAAG